MIIVEDAGSCRLCADASPVWITEQTNNAPLSQPVLERCGDCKYLGEESKERRGYYKCSIKGMDMRLHYFCGSWEKREDEIN